MLVALGAFLGGASGATVNLLVQEDTWIDGLSSTSTRGSDQRLGICPVADYWIYLKFDLTSVSGMVTSAELRLGRIDGSRPQELSLYLIEADNWREATLNGVNRPDPRDPANATALAAGEEAAAYDRWTSPELTMAVNQNLQSDGILSLMVREDPDSSFDVRHFFSREAPRPDEEKPRLVLTTSPLETVAPGWIVSNVGEGTKPAFDFDALGRVHVMGMTEELNGRIWYASAEHVEAPWSLVEVARGYFYGPGDLRVGHDGTVHMAWHNHELESPDHIAVRPNGQQDRYSIESPGLHDGWDNSLAVGADGTLHQASAFPSSFGATDSLQYGRFDGTHWTFDSAVAGSGSFMYGLNTSVAIDQQNDVHVVYCDTGGWTTPGDLQYALRDSAGWTFFTVVTNGISRFPVITTDHWSRPHVAWLELNPTNSRQAWVRYAVLNSGEWVVETVDTLEDVDMGFSGARKSVSLALDPDYRPHVAYGDQERIAYAEKPFDVWITTNVVEHERPTYNGLVVMRLDLQGRPGIVFWQPAEGLDGLVRMARPHDPDIRIFSPSVNPGSGAVTLRWSSGPGGMGYVVEARDNLVDAAWEPLSGPDLLTITSWTDPSASTTPERFYRIRGMPLP